MIARPGQMQEDNKCETEDQKYSGDILGVQRFLIKYILN